jgi:hypothetical protein
MVKLLCTIPEKDNVAISTIVTFAPHSFIAINSDENVCPTNTTRQELSIGSPIISGGLVHERGATT